VEREVDFVASLVGMVSFSLHFDNTQMIPCPRGSYHLHVQGGFTLRPTLLVPPRQDSHPGDEGFKREEGLLTVLIHGRSPPTHTCTDIRGKRERGRRKAD
jgi:hypothetical protein